jgi:hypothetical protein
MDHPDKVTRRTSGIGRENALKPQRSPIPECGCENCVTVLKWNAEKAAAKLPPPVAAKTAADSTFPGIILASREQVEKERALWTDMADYPLGRPDLPAFFHPALTKKKSWWERAVDWLFGSV